VSRLTTSGVALRTHDSSAMIAPAARSQNTVCTCSAHLHDTAVGEHDEVLESSRTSHSSVLLGMLLERLEGE